MRKIQWIASVIATVLVIFFLAGPFVAGLIFEKNYPKVLAFLNSRGEAQFELIQYKRGWFHSTALLSVKMIDPWLVEKMAPFGLKNFYLHQKIYHGPVNVNPAFFVGLAGIHNSIQYLVPQSRSILLENNDFISLSGTYHKHLRFAPFHLSFPERKTEGQIDGLVSDTWVWLGRQRVKAHIYFGKVVLTNNNRFNVIVPSLVSKADQHVSEHGLWLGRFSVFLPEVNFSDKNVPVFSIQKLKWSGESDEKNGLIQGFRSLEINSIHHDNENWGPVNVKVSVEKIDAKNLAQMADTYQSILANGEMYQFQLKNKLLSMIPGLLHVGSKIKIDSFNVATPEGKFLFQGELSWPSADVGVSDNLYDTLRDADLSVNARIDKLLADDMIDFAASLPFFERDTNELMEARTHIRNALQQNLVLIVFLNKNQRLTDDIGLQLLLSQKNDTLESGHYVSLLRRYFLNKEITLETKNLLAMQFVQIANQVELYQQQLKQVQNQTVQQIKNQIQAWMTQGYIQNTDKEYVVSLSRVNGKLNTKETLAK